MICVKIQLSVIGIVEVRECPCLCLCVRKLLCSIKFQKILTNIVKIAHEEYNANWWWSWKCSIIFDREGVS